MTAMSTASYLPPATSFNRDNFSRNRLKPDKKYHYALLTHHHVERVVTLFTKSFCQSEPMTAYLKMDEEKYKLFARCIKRKSLIVKGFTK